MHTATQLHAPMFSISVAGRAVTREELLPDWGPLDRFGIVVTEPLGGVGASLLIQLAITAFYDVRPARREQPLYPEVYLFDVGGPHGDHAYFDIFPSRKQVRLPRCPRVVLEAVNDRAITRIAVPAVKPRRTVHHWKEPDSALERIVSAFAYSPGGRVGGAEVEIRASDPRALANTSLTIHPRESYEEQRALAIAIGGVVMPADQEREITPAREDEVPPATRRAIGDARRALVEDGVLCETYRRLRVPDVLSMLG